MKDREAMQQAPEFTRGAKQKILRTYDKLHQNKLGAHWLWCAIERIANGEPESQVLAEFGYAAQVDQQWVETAIDLIREFAQNNTDDIPDALFAHLRSRLALAAQDRSPPVAPADDSAMLE